MEDEDSKKERRILQKDYGLKVALGKFFFVHPCDVHGAHISSKSNTSER